MNPRIGDWFLTFTGRQYWPLDPRPEDVDIYDIAHHLSLICRYNGACRDFYSVAQHACNVSDRLPEHLRLGGLMHDSTEAYCHDIIRPLKYAPGFREVYLPIEERNWLAICKRFNLSPHDDSTDNPEIKSADNRELMTVRRDLMTPSPHKWNVDESKYPPYPERIRPWSPKKAEAEFLTRFFALSA